MAQIFVFGRVMNDLVPKESQSKQSYVCFDLMERTKNWTQFYQVWAWDADVTRLMQFKVKKGSMIWLAGSQRLVCLLYTSPSPRDRTRSRMPSSA